MKNRFYIKDVVSILNLPRERFKEWVQRGYIKASEQESQGNRTINVYTRDDLYAIRLFDNLIKIGIHRQLAAVDVRAYMENVKMEKEDRVQEKTLFVAFFKRGFADHTMVRKDVKFPTIDDKGFVTSNKGLSPGVRFIKEKDLEKTFSALFLSFDDTDIPNKWDVSNLKFENVFIVDLQRLKEQVDIAVPL